MLLYIIKYKAIRLLLSFAAVCYGLHLFFFVEVSNLFLFVLKVFFSMTFIVFGGNSFFRLFPIREGHVSSLKLVQEDFGGMGCSYQMASRGFSFVDFEGVKFLFSKRVSAGCVKFCEANKMAYVSRPSNSFIRRYFDFLMKFASIILAKRKEAEKSVDGRVLSDCICMTPGNVLCLVNDFFEIDGRSVCYSNCEILDDVFSNQIVGNKVMIGDKVLFSSANMIPAEEDDGKYLVYDLKDSGLCNALRFVCLFVSSDGFVIDFSLLNPLILAKGSRTLESVSVLEAFSVSVSDSVLKFTDEYDVEFLGYVRTVSDGFPPTIVCKVVLACEIQEIEEKSEVLSKEFGATVVFRRESVSEFLSDEKHGSFSRSLVKFFVNAEV